MPAVREATGVGTWAWNVRTRKMFWSREYFRIFGVCPENTRMTYRAFFRMIHADERARVHKEFQAAVSAGQDFDAEYQIVLRDGSVRHIRSRAHPMFGELGQLREYVGTVVDVTEDKNHEESLVHMQAELARDFRAGIVRQLMATIAHEVNQPLTALVANAGAARRWLSGTPPRLDKARQALGRIVKDGNRASNIITRTRALVGGDRGRREPLNLNSVVQEVLLLMKEEIRRNQIVVRVSLADPMRPIPADRIQMQQVLVNLVLNAIEAMIGVSARSRLLAITTTSGVARVAVAVADRGVGLKNQELERIFEPFYTTKSSGMGIGLALCRSIIEAHGGRLSATSNQRGGATFRFQLPVHGDPVE